MGFLGIGAMEALVIVVIALIIFGPGRLPEIMGEAGRAVRDFRRATRELTGDFEDSIKEVRGTYEELERDMRTTAKDLKRDTQNIADEVNTAVSGATKGDSRPRTGTQRPATRRPLDQDEAFDASEDLTQYFPEDADTPERVAAADEPQVTPTKPAPRKKAPKAVAVPAAASNGAAHSDDLLDTEDGDDLLSIDN